MGAKLSMAEADKSELEQEGGRVSASLGEPQEKSVLEAQLQQLSARIALRDSEVQVCL